MLVGILVYFIIVEVEEYDDAAHLNDILRAEAGEVLRDGQLTRRDLSFLRYAVFVSEVLNGRLL